MVLAVGGYRLSSAEVLDLSGQNRTCKPVADYPHAAYDTAAATTHAQPVVCGGYIKETETRLSECYTYEHENNQWQPFPSLMAPRQVHRSLQLDEQEFLMAGNDIVLLTNKFRLWFL